MTLGLGMRFLKIKKTNSKFDSLALPVTYNPGDKFLAVGMSSNYNKSWGIVNFGPTENSQPFYGIYTDGLTYCCALAIVITNTNGELVKAAMLHLPGGFNEEFMEPLLDVREDILDKNERFQVIVKFGIQENWDKDETYNLNKVKSYLKILKEKYPGAENYTFFDSEITTTSHWKRNSSFAITKEGTVGLIDVSFPASGVNGQRREYLAFKAPNFSCEKEYFKNLISIEPEVQNQILLQEILLGLEKINNSNIAAQALFYSRHYIQGSRNASSQKNYLKKMEHLSSIWECKQLSLLVSSSFLVLPLPVTIPKLMSFFKIPSIYEQTRSIANKLKS